VKYAAIADWAISGSYPVTFMCNQLSVSTSGYYKWRHGAASDHAKTDAALKRLIKAIHKRLRGNPGVRRVHAGLGACGEGVSGKRGGRLMRAGGLQGRHPRAWRRTTVAGEPPAVASDLLGGAFPALRPTEKCCGDISYVKRWHGWGHIATVIDLH